MTVDTVAKRLRPEINDIISQGQQAAAAGGSVIPVAACAALSLLLLWVSFTPIDFAPAAWIALVPLCLLLRPRLLPGRTYRTLAAVGFLWALATLQWMRLGHISMYGALVALSFYMSLYVPAFVAMSRTVIRSGLPLWLAVPVVWTSLEFARAYLLTGFSWYYLGHTQYQWTALVQIADITGAYGISFLIALAAAATSICIPASLLVKAGLAEHEADVLQASAGQQMAAVAAALGLVLICCLYGASRAIPPEQMAAGPVVAVVQGNFAPEIKADSNKWTRIWMDHESLSRTAGGLQPDLIVWPETMYPERNVIIEDEVKDSDLISRLTFPGFVSNSDAARRIIEYWRSGQARKRIEKLSDETGAAMLVGLLTEVHGKQDQRVYNSAAFIQPHVGYIGRYDKRHRVPFGEYVPLQDVLPVLARLTPYSAGFGIAAGEDYSVFEYQNVHYAPIICFEDSVPHLVRSAATKTHKDGKTADVLVNLTNDAWFRGSSELDQHLITATFRCIELRRPMVRAVNGGISAFVDSCGRIRQPQHFLLMEEDQNGAITSFRKVDSMFDEVTGERRRQCSAVLCGQIPIDGRDSVYRRFGDWFPMVCMGVLLAAVVTGRFRRPTPTGTGEPSGRSVALAA